MARLQILTSTARETATAVPEHADLLARHRRVLPSWLALYYDEPIELVRGEGRHVTDAEGTHATSTSSAGSSPR